jgi:hypothetical protein
VNLLAEGLTELNLSGCSNLEHIKLRGNHFNNLTVLNLEGTKVKYIEFLDLNMSLNTSILDLRPFTNLSKSSNSSSYFKINNNPNVVNIRVDNDVNNPFYLHYHLQGCSALERIYGHVRLNCTSCFYNDSSFSIHGSDLSSAK